MTAKTLMIQGTTSDAGKSAVVTGLCRVLARRGVRVVPFKPQNMALNSAVTMDGGEIGRSQAVPVRAAGLEPHSDMNPVLLKPNTDTGAPVIIQGRAVGNMDARAYHAYKAIARQAVLDSYARLRRDYELILVEGAGSPAEINLRENDIANMGFAEAVDCPVWLVGDLDRGGVFAQLVGTLAVLPAGEQARIRGFIIDRFRGDPALLEPGLRWLEQQTGRPVVGVLPYLHGLHLETEDSLSRAQAALKPEAGLQDRRPGAGPDQRSHRPGPAAAPSPGHGPVGPSGRSLAADDLIVLPGSKSIVHITAAARAGLGQSHLPALALWRQGDRPLRRLSNPGPGGARSRRFRGTAGRQPRLEPAGRGNRAGTGEATTAGGRPPGAGAGGGHRL